MPSEEDREASSFSTLKVRTILLGLAPDGGYQAAALLRTPVVSYTTFSPLPLARRYLFLWPDPAGCPTPGVTRHRALWSADFPRLNTETVKNRDHPIHLGFNNYTRCSIHQQLEGRSLARRSL
jgi:hypothetical protein